MVLLTYGGFEEIWRRQKKELEAKIKGKIADSGIETSSYSTNAGNFEIAPVAVVTPEGVEDVVELVRFCRKYGIPLTARGAGSSLTDAALGYGVVVDLSRNLNSILALDIENNLVTVGAGITLEALNTELKKYDKMVPIFPIKGWKCTVGGCIAEDAGGFLAVSAGRMHDLVVSLDAITPEGETIGLSRNGKESPVEDSDLLRSRVRAIVKEGGRSFRGTCGYRLESLLGEAADYVDLVCGSEGSLAVIVSATLKLVDRIDGATSSIVSFSEAKKAFEYAAALSGRVHCAEFLDSVLTREFCNCAKIPPPPAGTAASMVVIWKEGETPPEASEGQAVVGREIEQGPESVLACMRDSIHRLQRPGSSGRYVAAAEGVEISPPKLQDLMLAVEGISTRYALKCTVFGHAAEGIMYVRPLLNLRREDDRHKLSSFLRELATALRAEGGRISSENGMGVQLQPFAKYAVDEGTLQAFDLIRKAFDPLKILGGRRIFDDDDQLPFRFGPEHDRKPFRPLLNWNTQDIISRFGETPLPMAEEIDACHGCGECRALSFIETQCPVYKTMGSELTSPRGLNNLVRVLSNTGGVPTIALYTSEYTRSIYDYCIQCKMCAVECPSHVNTPKIIIEARSQHVKRLGASAVGRASRFFSDYELFTMVASSVARLSNRLIRSKNARSALEHAFGIDRRRKIPDFDLEPFVEWFGKHVTRPGMKGEIAYFSDVYANYFDPRIGRAVVGLLEELGYSTLYPRQHFTGAPLIYLGLLRDSKKYLLENISYLYPYAVRGMPVVCSSPSAVMALRNDYPGVVDDERSRVLSRAVADVHDFILSVIKTSGRSLKLKPVAKRILYHPSCHSRALGTDRKVAELLRQIPGADVVEMQAGCCGAGGSYGFATETFNLSLEIGRNVFREVGNSGGGGTVIVTDGEECALQIEQATGIAPEMTLILLARAAGLSLPKATVARRGS